ncbi:MAG: hypothetical protein ACK5QX_03070 [bacterium]|jgi:hypothetical protein
MDRTGELSQAERIVRRFGGGRRVAALLNLSPSAVSRWSMPAAKGGCGGVIPSKRLKQLRDAADLLGLEISPEDWLP